jgi:hypothetical protein
LIVPGAFPDYGKSVQLSRVGHNGILFHPECIELVIRCIAQREKATP